MSIHFIPNDPIAVEPAPGLQKIAERADPPRTEAGFTYRPAVPGPLPPAQVQPPGTPVFLYWQCREAALAALATWALHAGAPLKRWQPGRKIDLVPDAVATEGEPPTLNAFYDRRGLVFFHDTVSGRTVFSGASTDVVAHEAGHALLDALRPDLWDTPYLEVAAFHEAFGDCIAILTALADPASARAVEPLLGQHNFVETTAEELADAIRHLLPTHNAASPRMALNRLQWQLPRTLPSNGGPGALINESHSFARIFSGCFWDLLRGLAAGAGQSLASATSTAARLLIGATGLAKLDARFFQSVGRAMIVVDESASQGARHDVIRDAFSGHGIALGTNAMLAPTGVLAGSAPKAAAVRLQPSTLRSLRQHLGARAAAPIEVRRFPASGAPVARAVHLREVPLGEVHRALRGVVALAPETVLVGGSGGRAAALGAMPTAMATSDEVLTYVESLVRHRRIEPAASTRRTAARVGRYATHAIRSQRGKRVLTRLRFACR
jgi:hypothetical protein